MPRLRKGHNEKNNAIISTSSPDKCIKRNEKGNFTNRRVTTSTFANALYDKDIGQMLDYKKFINHNKKEIQEW